MPALCADDIGRRAFLGLLGLAAVEALTACVYKGHSALPAAAGLTPESTPPSTAHAARAVGPSAPIGSPVPGPPLLIDALDVATNQIALTIDDGTCAGCVARYVEFAESSGLALSFSPNGRVRDNWDPHAAALRELISAGRVQIINHTWSHADLLHRSDVQIRDDVRRNEGWIEDTFGVTSRPWFRPPFGSHSARTDEAVAALGYTHILLWNGTFGDSGSITPATLRRLANQYLRPGTIMLGHANVSTIDGLFDEIVAMINERGLHPVLMADAVLPTTRHQSNHTGTTLHTPRHVI